MKQQLLSFSTLITWAYSRLGTQKCCLNEWVDQLMSKKEALAFIPRTTRAPPPPRGSLSCSCELPKRNSILGTVSHAHGGFAPLVYEGG